MKITLLFIYFCGALSYEHVSLIDGDFIEISIGKQLISDIRKSD
jgi:hypothetical protein